MQRALPAFRCRIQMPHQPTFPNSRDSNTSNTKQAPGDDTQGAPGGMAPTASLRVCDDGVAEVTLHNPPVNALHPDRACPPPSPFSRRPARALPLRAPPGMLSWRPPG